MYCLLSKIRGMISEYKNIPGITDCKFYREEYRKASEELRDIDKSRLTSDDLAALAQFEAIEEKILTSSQE